MTKDLIRYDLLVQDALKSVVRKVLTDAARDGLPGEHHFYVSFRTPSPGVRLSQRMRDKYPEEMTIVLQHQFWDLGVTEHAFEVGLSFGGVPERLLVPFDAVTAFFDPSVSFGLKFEQRDAANEAGEEPTGGGRESMRPAVVENDGPRLVPARPALASASRTEPEPAPAKPLAARPEPLKNDPGKDASSGRGKASDKASVEKPAPDKAEAPKQGRGKSARQTSRENESEAPEGGAQVVSLDAFRKKT